MRPPFALLVSLPLGLLGPAAQATYHTRSALFIGQVDAHGLWTEQRRGNIKTIYGHCAEDNAFKAEKISGAWAYDRAAR